LFSSRGPTVDYRIKPDIVAPGVFIWAALARDSYLEYLANQNKIPAIDVDGDGRYDYVALSGTSMATPHVSGVAALLKQLNPYLTPEEIKNILISTANDLDYNVYEQGGGRVDVEAAINTPILVEPATISLGPITEDIVVNTTITFTFKPLTTVSSDIENITLTLEVIIKDIITGDIINTATLNATTITIPLNESRAVQLSINMSIPRSIYEGKVIARVIEGPWENRTVHTILGFARLNKVVIKMIDKNGAPAAYRPVVIFEHNATFYPIFTGTDENGEARVYLPSGEFYIIGRDWDYNVHADVGMIADRVPIYENTVIMLDGRRTKEVNFDPAKPNQVFAAKRVIISYRAPTGYGFSFYSLWYYPSTALTYITNTTLSVSFSYEYYDMDYFNAADPSIIDAPEWHNLIFWQSGITPPVTYVANYSNLVRRVTEYRVPMTPRLAARLSQHKFSPLEWLSVEFSWFMNVPRARVEWLTPYVYYWTSYEKYRDPPWTYTPYWYYAYWPFIKEIYPLGEVREVFGGHPLSTHFLVLVGYDWLDMVSDLFMDTYGHTLWWTDGGYVRIYCNDSLILEGYVMDVMDFFLYSWRDSRPARYRVEIESWSGLWISNYAYTTLEFTVINETTYYTPPSLFIDVPCLNLNNTCPAGEIILNVYVNDPRVSSEANVTVKFSVDDGVTWTDATPLEHSAGKPYSFSLGTPSNAYVSLWINATDNVGSSISMKVIRGFSVTSRKLTLADLPEPFVIKGTVNTMIIVGASNPRGPCNAAHTIDVAAGMYVAFALGTKSTQGIPEILLDWQVTNYDEDKVIGIFKKGNIITFGGLGVNLITWYYHSLTYRGIQVLDTYMASDEEGIYIYSTATKSKYRMVNDYGQGTSVTDYAMIVLHYDDIDDRYVLLIAGLSGYSTSEATKWLSSYPSIDGKAVILKMTDNEGDGIIDNIEIAELIQ